MDIKCDSCNKDLDFKTNDQLMVIDTDGYYIARFINCDYGIINQVHYHNPVVVQSFSSE